MNRIKNILLLSVSIMLFDNVYSQDLKAGELNVLWISGKTYKATIDFYYESNNFYNRPFLMLNWGDGNTDTVAWNSSFSGCGDSNSLSKTFQKIHTYSNDGTFIITCVDSFLINNINNVSNSNLENLHLQYTLVIDSTYPGNSSPKSLNCLTDNWTGTNWVYNPGAYDSDGDSLVYSVIALIGVANYTFPNYTINSQNGDFALFPTAIGSHIICMKIDEWKYMPGTNVRYYFGSTYRNMLLYVNSLTTINKLTKAALRIYPTPSSAQITIEFESPLQEKTSIEITNVLGQKVKQIENKTGLQKIEIDVSEFSSGIYSVRFKNETQQATSKFIKN